MRKAKYVVYGSPELPTGEVRCLGRYTSLAAARKVAKDDVTVNRGASECGIPACAGPNAVEAYIDRDGDQDSTIAWIEVL